MPYYRYDGHFDEIGNRIVADTVYKWLFAGTAAPFPSLTDAAGAAQPVVRVKKFPF